MFSAAKFVLAAVIVALFGGFLLSGVLTTQQIVCAFGKLFDLSFEAADLLVTVSDRRFQLGYGTLGVEEFALETVFAAFGAGAPGGSTDHEHHDSRHDCSNQGWRERHVRK